MTKRNKEGSKNHWALAMAKEPEMNPKGRSHWGNLSKNVITKDLKDDSHPEE